MQRGYLLILLLQALAGAQAVGLLPRDFTLQARDFGLVVLHSLPRRRQRLRHRSWAARRRSCRRLPCPGGCSQDKSSDSNTLQSAHG
jgi:hypothetical protein